MRRADVRRAATPTPINPSPTSAKIQSGRPVNGRCDDPTVFPSRVVAPSTPPAGLAFVGWSATTAPLTPPTGAGLATVRLCTAVFVNAAFVVCCADCRPTAAAGADAGLAAA